MSAIILDGKATAAAIKAELAERVAVLKAAGIHPGLGTVLVGDDPGSHAYVGGKHRDCAEVGIVSVRVDLPADTTQEQLDDEIRDGADDLNDAMNGRKTQRGKKLAEELGKYDPASARGALELLTKPKNPEKKPSRLANIGDLAKPQQMGGALTNRMV